MEELQQRLIKDRTPKRPARPFGPLVPQQRPLILPGGRRWRTPKDAFNEDFIAEINSLLGNLSQHRKVNFVGSMLQHHLLSSTKYMSKWIEEKNKK